MEYDAARNDPARTRIKIIIGEDQEYLREGIQQILAAQPDLEVIGTARNGLEALQMALDLTPDVILLDIHMPGMNGIDVAQHLREKEPSIGLLILSQYDDAAYIHQFLNDDLSGKGYLLKSTLGDVKALVQAIKAVASRQMVLEPQIARRLFQTSTSGLKQLTRQELRILAEMACGRDNQAIAETLTIERSTVENHINAIYSKLEIGQEAGRHRRVEAVLRFLKGD
ncbi:MAG TPA: response regulator transcription factor [Phototrophicaceae bacterium]|jgi:DNA-binding NarL/FixJ family response regulator|nr:response regulator transcription factor [Phototrophicaceae bacterium]